MDFDNVEKFLRDHWPAVLMTTLLVSPASWTLSSQISSQRIEQLKADVEYLKTEKVDLNNKIAALEELARRSSANLAASTSSFTADELFTPSSEIQVVGGEEK